MMGEQEIHTEYWWGNLLESDRLEEGGDGRVTLILPIVNTLLIFQSLFIF
jgi:hypothetical protein